MWRTVLRAGIIPFLSAFLGIALAFSVVVPSIVDAQVTRVRAEAVTIVGAGTDRVRLATKWDGQASDFALLAPDGTERLVIGAGGIAVNDPAGSGINITAEDGTQVARFGTGHGPLGTLPLTTQMFLNDQSGQARIRLSVAEDGTPAMLIYDGAGAVIWSAP
jgi:hypothetical protein